MGWYRHRRSDGITQKGVEADASRRRPCQAGGVASCSHSFVPAPPVKAVLSQKAGAQVGLALGAAALLLSNLVPSAIWLVSGLAVLSVAFLYAAYRDFAPPRSPARTESTMGPHADCIVGAEALISAEEPLTVEALGTTWNASLICSDVSLPKGTRVRVVGREGLTLLVAEQGELEQGEARWADHRTRTRWCAERHRRGSWRP